MWRSMLFECSHLVADVLGLFYTGFVLGDLAERIAGYYQPHNFRVERLILQRAWGLKIRGDVEEGLSNKLGRSSRESEGRIP